MDGLLTTTEAAAYLKIHPDSLRRKASKRQVPFERVGPKNLRFRREVLDRWMAAGCPGVDELGRMADPAGGETP